MSNPIIRIHDLETNEVIDREMTDEEFAQYEANEATILAAEEIKAQQTAMKAEVLQRLGITEDEAKALLS